MNKYDRECIINQASKMVDKNDWGEIYLPGETTPVIIHPEIMNREFEKYRKKGDRKNDQKD